MKNGKSIGEVKKIAIVLTLALCFLMTGCKKGDVYESSELGNKYIDLQIIYIDEAIGTEVVYDKNTGVMYFIKTSGYQFGITPIYNADGSLKLYDGKDLSEEYEDNANN